MAPAISLFGLYVVAKHHDFGHFSFHIVVFPDVSEQRCVYLKALCQQGWQCGGLGSTLQEGPRGTLFPPPHVPAHGRHWGRPAGQ